MTDAALTDRRSITSRQNALHSTGPRTPAGRARSSLNALRHGLAAARVVVPGEDQAEFDALRDEIVEGFQPQTIIEAVLVERIVLACWRLRRAGRAERDLIEDGVHADTVDRAHREIAFGSKSLMESLRALGDKEQDPAKAAVENAKLESALKARAASQTTIGRAFARTEKDGQLAAVERHERGIENALYKALHELERLQRGRWERVEPPVAVDLTITSNEGLDGSLCHDRNQLPEASSTTQG